MLKSSSPVKSRDSKLFWVAHLYFVSLRRALEHWHWFPYIFSYQVFKEGSDWSHNEKVLKGEFKFSFSKFCQRFIAE